MALDLNGFAVLRSIGDHASSFRAIGAEVNKAARALVVKQLGAKTMTLANARSLRKMIGEDAFVLVIEGMKDAQVRSLLTKLDKHHPELKTETAKWRRERVMELAAGDAEPAEKVKGAPKVKAPRKKKRPDTRERLHSEAMTAVRKR